MIEVLQKVTTFPVELIVLPTINNLLYNEKESELIHKYYSDVIKNETKRVGSVSEDELTALYTPDTVANATGSVPVSTSTRFDAQQIDDIKKRFIIYNGIYDKLFANNLNVLENTDEPTVIVFPIHAQQDKGKVFINPKASRYYYDKFDKIKKFIQFDKNICYIGLNVFTNESSKEEYKKYIATQFNNIKQLITVYNDDVKRRIRTNATTQQTIKRETCRRV
jgi:hypothetical protein